jgi:hypothetical protein
MLRRVINLRAAVTQTAVCFSDCGVAARAREFGPRRTVSGPDLARMFRSLISRRGLMLTGALRPTEVGIVRAVDGLHGGPTAERRPRQAHGCI